MATLEQIENERVELEKELQKAINLELPVKQERAQIKIDMARARLKILELNKGLEMSKNHTENLQTQLSLKKQEFWRLKNELGA